MSDDGEGAGVVGVGRARVGEGSWLLAWETSPA